MSEYRKVLYEYVTPTIAGAAVLLNSIEIFTLFKSKARRKGLASMFILSLSCSDWFVGILMIVLKSMHPYMTSSLKTNHTAQDLYDVIRFVGIRFALFISIFNLIALTIDRLMAAVRPFAYRVQSGKFGVAVCSAIWVSSIILVSIYYSIATKYFKGEVHVNLVFTVSVFSATCVFIVCYGIIFRTIALRRTQPADVRKTSTDVIGGMSIVNARRNRTEIRLLKVAVKNVCIFIVCWSPLAVASLIESIETEAVSKPVFSTCFTLAFCSTVVNPILFLIKSRKSVTDSTTVQMSPQSKGIR